MTSTDFKLIKEKKMDKGTTLKITQNLASGRIFVQFTSTNPNLMLQKSFQDNWFGKNDSEKFAKSIKNTSQLLAYFGIKEQ